MDKGLSLLDRLNKAISKDEGFRILHEEKETLNDEFVSALLNRANEQQELGDKDGAMEFHAWAEEARGIVTLNLILSTFPDDAVAARKILELNMERFDDPFADLIEGIAQSSISPLFEIVNRFKGGDAKAAAELEPLVGEATFYAHFLGIIANLTQKPYQLAKARLTDGTLSLIASQIEDSKGNSTGAASARDRAKSVLTTCIEAVEAPTYIRAAAHMNLAVLAGPENQDEVEVHQKAAQLLAEGEGNRELAATNRRDRAYWARQRGAWKVAYDLYKQNIDDMEREIWKPISPIASMDLVSSVTSDFTNVVEVCLELAKADKSYFERALEFADQGKARSFLRSIAEIGRSSGKVPDRLQSRHNEILRRMQTLGAKITTFDSYDAAIKRLPEMELLQNALGDTESQIDGFTKVRALNLQSKPLDFKEIVKLVPSGGMILSYFCLPDSILIFPISDKGLSTPVVVPISHQDQTRVMVNIIGTLRLGRDHQLLDDLEKKLGSGVSSYFNPIHNLNYLFNKLIEPVKNLLEGCNILYIIPHGFLSDLPFHALLSPDGTALIDEHPIAYSPSLAVLRQCMDHNRSNLGTCFASGVDSSKGGPISAKGEAALVAQFFNTLPMPANHDEFNSHAGNCDVIHLACHGITSESWPGNVVTAFQGLRLEDGPLYQREIANIKCKSSLVFLSACETARGDVLRGNEMAGLIGSFIRAGAPSVIASLWPLADSAAKPFAEEFYKALMHDNLSRAQALQQAQKRIKSQGGFSHPYFWAPFCLWGAA